MSAGVAGLGVTGSMAGCSALPFFGGPGYKQWVYEPGTVGDEDNLTFNYANIKTVVDNEDNFNSDIYELFERTEDSFPQSVTDIDLDDMQSTVSFDRTGTIEADFNKDDVVGELEDNDFEEDGDEGNFTVYVDEENTQAVGVSGGRLVHGQASSFGDTDATDYVEAIIGAKNGDEDLYHEGNDDFNELTNKLNDGTFISGGTQDEVEETTAESGRFEGVVATGSSVSVNGETTKTQLVYLFDSSDDIDMGDVEDFTEDADAFDDYDNVNSSQNGRAAVITADIDTDDWEFKLAGF
jgi:hypothetical protein